MNTVLLVVILLQIVAVTGNVGIMLRDRVKYGGTREGELISWDLGKALCVRC